ncbi:MAG: D-Ala-D-Ala carboxypeptidase family metallohydrolase [Alphaproteobacteria bacterium]
MRIDPKTEVAEHLLLREVACHCERCAGVVAPMHVRAYFLWLHVRQWHGSPIEVVSGFRCRERNRAIGGSANSQHMAGLAFDLELREEIDLLSDEFLRSMIDIGAKGIGRGPSQLHLDAREGPAQFWLYQSGGGAVRDGWAHKAYEEMTANAEF